MTGKGGRYRYYKCNTRIGKGIDYCKGGKPNGAPHYRRWRVA